MDGSRFNSFVELVLHSVEAVPVERIAGDGVQKALLVGFGDEA